MSQSRTRRVHHLPSVHRGFDCGVDQLVAAIAPTLGPIPRTVAVERPDSRLTPELLDDGATIARRLLALPNLVEDVGAMYLRGLLWRLHEEIGDGTATAAILFRALLAGGRRAVTAGYHTQLLRPYIEQAGEFVVAELMGMAQPIKEHTQLRDVALSVSHDAEMTDLLTDVFDVVGEFGRVDLLAGQRRESYHEFVEGSYWQTSTQTKTLLSGYLYGRAQLSNPAIVLTDLDIADSQAIVSAIDAALSIEAEGLLIICKSLAGAAVGVVAANHHPESFPILAVKIPGFAEPDRIAETEDLALLTGAHPFRQAAGDRLRLIDPDNLGSARRAWVTKDQFGIISGQGDVREIRCHVEQLATTFDHTTDHEKRQKLLGRLGTFQGGSATVRLAASTETATKHRVATAERTVRVLRTALRSGIVAGGGVAFLACRHRLFSEIATTNDPLAKVAYQIVLDALSAPAQTLLANSGREAAPLLAHLDTIEPNIGFDARTGQLLNVVEAGIVDPAAVLASVAQITIKSAALALTIDTIVHRPKSEITTNPEG